MSGRWLALLPLLVVACSSGGPPDASVAPPLARDGALAFSVVLPADTTPGLDLAAADLLAAAASISGTAADAQPVRGALADAAHDVVVCVDLATPDATIGEQGYALTAGDLGQGRIGVRVAARTATGAMYGLYHLLADLGVRYLHPEQTFFPTDPSATLPWSYTGEAQSPHFALRGFHEHTQHPIPFSDFYMRPDEPGYRAHVSNYLKWLARNRQNVATFILLKTVDAAAWTPWMADIVDEGHGYGIRMGLVLSFLDEQQNAYKIVRDDADTPDTAQIEADLDRFAAIGFDDLTFQIGTSEFSKPPDSLMLGYLDHAVAYLRDTYPAVHAWAWIHTTCDLKAEDGGYYYHLPLKADADLGAWLHTTMFYDLTHPAPVYECEDFGQQIDFATRASGQRPITYFPETAWWLGFDINCPVVLPITGWTRHHDVSVALAPYEVTGHVTFSSGREWTYWQYDHFLTRLTWDGTSSWADYLAWLAPVFGAQGQAVATALDQWAEQQVQDFLVDNPLIYFYVAGELQQDEIGEQAGILARRPKIAFQTVYGYDDATLAAWKARDLDYLAAMRDAYQALLDPLPAALDEGSDLQKALYAEVVDALSLYVMRLDHTIALYEGVVEARRWRVEKEAAQAEGREPDGALRAQALDAAEGKLAAAQALSAGAIATIAGAEARYRYPVEIMARAKPATKTAYPFGYLEQTHTGHFWTRRDDQLEVLIGRAFDTWVEAWSVDPPPDPAHVAFAGADQTTVTTPPHPMAASVIGGFMPRFLFAAIEFDLERGSMALLIGLDANENGLPDADSEARVEGSVQDDGVVTRWFGNLPALAIQLATSAGQEIGTLTVFDAAVGLKLAVEGAALRGLESGTLDGEIRTQALVDTIMLVGGIDAEGTRNLVAQVFGYPSGDDLPERLPIGFAFVFEPLDTPNP